jgi:hypothetical protein
LRRSTDAGSKPGGDRFFRDFGMFGDPFEPGEAIGDAVDEIAPDRRIAAFGKVSGPRERFELHLEILAELRFGIVDPGIGFGFRDDACDIQHMLLSQARCVLLVLPSFALCQSPETGRGR